MQPKPRTQHLKFALQSIWPDDLIMIVQLIIYDEQPCFDLTQISYLISQLQLTSNLEL